MRYYVLPTRMVELMEFLYLCAEGESLLFHGAKEGRKIDSMRANHWACAVIVGDTTIIPEKFGRKYESAIIEVTNRTYRRSRAKAPGYDLGR